MDKDKLIKQQQREIDRYQTLLRDAEGGLDITEPNLEPLGLIVSKMI